MYRYRRLFAAATAIPFFQFHTAKCSTDPRKMPMTTLGGTALVVSKLSFGFWATFGAKADEDVDSAAEIMEIARNAGINLFDNAETYGNPQGRAEEIMGDALEYLMSEKNPTHENWKRSRIVITTKLFWGGSDINEKGLSRKHVIEGMDASLKRLKLDYVDLVFCHRPDVLGNMEETVRAFTQLIRDGKALYWGTSEWSAVEIAEAYWIAKVHNLIPPVVEQPQYNMFHRDRVEQEYSRLYQHPYRIGTTIWSPLASGILTGKYNKEIPKGSRMDSKGYEWLAKVFDNTKAERIPKVEKLMEIAERLGCSVTQLAIAWCAKNENVSTVLLGSSRKWQLEENLGAVRVLDLLTPEIMEEIEFILGNKPASTRHYGRSLL